MAEAAFKPEKDFSKQVDELLPQAEELAKAGLPGLSIYWMPPEANSCLDRPAVRH